MAPVPPQRLATPLLVEGAATVALAATLGDLGFNVKVLPTDHSKPAQHRTRRCLLGVH